MLIAHVAVAQVPVERGITAGELGKIDRERRTTVRRVRVEKGVDLIFLIKD